MEPLTRRDLRSRVRTVQFNNAFQHHDGFLKALDARSASGDCDQHHSLPRMKQVIRIYDGAGNVIETHEHKDELKKVVKQSETKSRHAVKRDG